MLSMPAGSRFRLRLAKEDFKFSVAHFTLFGAHSAEPLHGHNYRMTIEVEGEALDELGLLVDSDRVKRAVRALCAELDDHVLLPAESPHVEIRRDGGSLDCRFAERNYRLPAGEALLLPLANVSMELLAVWSWRRLAPQLAGASVRHLAVEIEESPGQAARYAAPLS